MKHIPFTIVIFSFFLGMGTESFGQDPDKPDLRESCGICQGKANNYSILNVYFSDSEGSPNIVCGDTEETLYISVLYSSNSKNAIHNVRLIADIVKKDRDVPDMPIGDPIYINEFFGTVDPCPDGTCIFTVALPIGFKIDCKNEFYELSQPLVAWTPNTGDNLINSYECQDYPKAQCLNQPTILIDVGDVLTYSFVPLFDCFSGDINQTNVSYVLTSLFGGNPTLPYTTEWEFIFSDGTPTQNSNEFNPVLLNKASGSIIDAYLTVSQGGIIGEKILQTDTVPLALLRGDVIQGFETVDTDEGESNGIIDVTFLEKDIFYFWTSLEDSLFYSQDSRIDSLSAGTYELTTINNETGTCRTDLFDINARILPVEYIYNRTNYNLKARTSLISWATGKEWESSHFEIERANQGVNFEKIGEVNAAGWSNQITTYNFEDRNLPLSAGTILYRIKQVDLNEKIGYSSVMSIRTPEVEATKGVWRAFPNPTEGNQLRIGLVDKTQLGIEKIRFRLVHPSFQSRVITVASEAELNDALATMTGQIPKGVFVVEIQWGQKVEFIKVLKP